MILVDVNVLIYAVNRHADQHEVVRAAWESALRGVEPIGLPWAVLSGFLRIVTSPRALPHPVAANDAIDCVSNWLAQDNVVVVAESENHWAVMQELLRKTGVAGKLVADAHLAALAISRDAKLASCDRDFGRFAGLRWVNPLTQTLD